ncbi:MAG: hypothetical protein M3450_02435 [Actinomycetota bacterium]|nr:hypothetical protein [Actinomycetota bacterium]
MEVFQCPDAAAIQARIRSFVQEMDARREPYGYVEGDEPMTLRPEDGTVDVSWGDVSGIVRLLGDETWEEAEQAALEAGLQERDQAATVVLVISGTGEVTGKDGMAVQVSVGQGVLLEAGERGSLSAAGGPLVYYQVEGRSVRRDHFATRT